MTDSVGPAAAGIMSLPAAGDDRHARVVAMQLLGRLLRALTRPTDTAGLVAFRVIFGLLICTSALRFIVYGWVERFFVQPTYMFKYWGFSWVQVWPAWGMYLHLLVLAVLGLCVAAGVYYRFSAALLLLCFGYLQLIDASLYLNHYYFITLVAALMVIMPLGSAGSVDARRDPSQARQHFPAWCTYLLRFQLGLVYFYAGLAKFGGDWLIHAQPLNIWLNARSEMPLIGGLFEYWWVALAMSWAGFLYDITIVGWLSWKRTRPYAYAVVLAFHLLTHLLFNIGMFPLIMSACALIFFSPSWPRHGLAVGRRWLTAVRSRWRGAQASVQVSPSPPQPALAEPAAGDDGHVRAEVAVMGRHTLGFGLLAAYLLIQVLMPLRHFFYPGDVLWNEQGMRWAWKVKIRAKNGAISYRVVLPDGRRHIITPRRYLADYQEREMSGQPDLILQLAHHIGDEYALRQQGPVRVYADAQVSLNGRPSAPLIDPTVDLMQLQDGVAAYDWVLPAPSSKPIRLGRLSR